MPPPPNLFPPIFDPILERWRLRIGIAGTLLMAAYIAILPLLAP
jgi:hypothetical protein